MISASIGHQLGLKMGFQNNNEVSKLILFLFCYINEITAAANNVIAIDTMHVMTL